MGGFVVAAAFEFDDAVFDVAGADDDADGEAEEVDVVEFDACGLAEAVVVEDFIAEGLELVVGGVGGLLDFFFVGVEGD